MMCDALCVCVEGCSISDVCVYIWCECWCCVFLLFFEVLCVFGVACFCGTCWLLVDCCVVVLFSV